MSETPESQTELGPDSIERGFHWKGDDVEELARVMEFAFDYRGDVTLELRSGGDVEGYLANRDTNVPEPFALLFCADGSKRQVPYRDISSVSFSGKDTASGKSWESWLKKWNAKKEAEQRGEKVGDIGLYPESLD